jgi:hypothetical protein
MTTKGTDVHKTLLWQENRKEWPSVSVKSPGGAKNLRA